MLLVKTFVAPSKIHGLGLFAAEDIPTGQPVWAFRYQWDVIVPGTDTLTPAQRDFVEKYCQYDDVCGGWVMCGDDARFMNHADDANLISIWDWRHILPYDFAKRNIPAGEEITCDYRAFGEWP